MERGIICSNKANPSSNWSAVCLKAVVSEPFATCAVQALQVFLIWFIQTSFIYAMLLAHMQPACSAYAEPTECLHAVKRASLLMR